MTKNTVNTIDSKICNVCNNLLDYRTEKKSRCIECEECSYDDRPFGWCRSYKGPCTCKYEYHEVSFYVCTFCSERKCQTFMCTNIIFDDQYKIIKFCSECKKKADEEIKRQIEEEKQRMITLEKERKEFNKNWKLLTVEEKLKFYGVTKLRVLAKQKKLRGFTKWNKQELIINLLEKTTDKDFPIKK